MLSSPLLTLLSFVLPAKLQGISYVTQVINQLLLPPTIDAAVYLDLQRVVKLFGPTRQWTVGAMDGAAARGRLDIVQWLGRTRSEGCSSVAFNEAAANGHLDVVCWLCQFDSSKCNPEKALIRAAQAGHLEVIKRLQAEFPLPPSRDRYYTVCYATVLEAAVINEHFEVLEFLVLQLYVRTEFALATAAKNGLMEVVRMIVRGSTTLNNMELLDSHALEYAAAKGYVDIIALLIKFCYGHWGKKAKALALKKAAEAGQLAAVVMLEPRSTGVAIGGALGLAIANGHDEIVEFLFRRCPAAEMVPAMVAAADRDSHELLERILAKRERKKVVVVDLRMNWDLCPSFRSAASRGSEKIVMLLIDTMLSAWDIPMLKDAASHSKYELVKYIVDAMKARQLSCPLVFGNSVFDMACRANDVEMKQLILKYSHERVLDEQLFEQLKKKQKTTYW